VHLRVHLKFTSNFLKTNKRKYRDRKDGSRKTTQVYLTCSRIYEPKS
jgi:hypothetical protein